MPAKFRLYRLYFHNRHWYSGNSDARHDADSRNKAQWCLGPLRSVSPLNPIISGGVSMGANLVPWGNSYDLTIRAGRLSRGQASRTSMSSPSTTCPRVLLANGERAYSRPSPTRDVCTISSTLVPGESICPRLFSSLQNDRCSPQHYPQVQALLLGASRVEWSSSKVAYGRQRSYALESSAEPRASNCSVVY